MRRYACFVLLLLTACGPNEEKITRLRTRAEGVCLVTRQLEEETDSIMQVWIVAHRGEPSQGTPASDSLDAVMRTYGDSISQWQTKCDLAQREYDNYMR